MVLKFETKSEMYKRIEELNKNLMALTNAHYQLISLLVPEVKPTKSEKLAIKRKEKLVALSEIEKRLK